jgi:ankyrin repeat protein
MKGPSQNVFSTLRQTMFTLLCFAVFAFPLFGQNRTNLTRDLREVIEGSGRDRIARAESLLAAGADPNGIFNDRYKETFLMKAGHYYGSAELTKLLLDYGADPNVRDSNGNTAAHYADDSDAVEILRLLAAKGARFDITNNRNISPLIRYIDWTRSIAGVAFILEWEETHSPGFAAGFPDRKAYCTRILGMLMKEYSSRYDNELLPIAERLLKAGVDANGTYHDWGEYYYPFFIQAVDRGFNRVAGLLLDYGADPEVRDKDNRSAAFHCNTEGAALLASRGIRFDVTDKWGNSPLMGQGASDSPEAIIILEWEEQHSPDFSARFENRKDYLTHILTRSLSNDFFGDFDVPETYTFIEKLLDGGANPAAMYDGIPVAYLAVKPYIRTHFVIPMLIERGAPLDALNKNGETILYIAASTKNVELIRFLLGKGADPDQQCSSGETALMAACSGIYSDRANIQELWPAMEIINSGADPNLKDSKGETVLMKTRNRQLADLLFNSGADPTLKDLKGQTTLHHWIRFLDRPLLDELISRGCFIDEPDLEGVTPLLLAAQYNYGTAVTLLLEKGADPNLRDSNGRTALHRYMLWVEYLNDSSYRDNDYTTLTTALLTAGAHPADTDNEENSALQIVIHLSRKHREMIPLRDLILQYANADEIKAAESMAAKTYRKEKRDDFRYNITEYLPAALKYFSFPLIVGGLSIGLREGTYRNDYSQNFMGSINGVFNFTMGGMVLGALMLMPLASNGGWDFLVPIFGGFIGGMIGFFGGIILVATVPSIGRTINNNPIFYYAPTVVSAIASLIFFKVSY